MPLPRQVQIDRIKITGYLLSTNNPRSRAKAEFFTRFGFEANRWEELAEALRKHADTNEVSYEVETDYGSRFHVDGPTGNAG